MRLVLLHDEVGHHVLDRFGSDLIHVRTADVRRGRVDVLHLPPGGRVGRHDAAATQVFVVASGSGWVEDGDGNRLRIGVGRAAVWEAGESHAVDTEEGLTALVIEGSIDVLAPTGWDGPITVAEHDPAWADWFRAIHDHVWPAVSHVATRIDHVGSTSVPGLAAKPIIDTDVVVDDPAKVPEVSKALATLGYRWRGDLGVQGRQAYARLEVDPFLPPNHLYCVVDGSRAHLDHVLLRDLLRVDPEARERYAALKRRNAVDADGDMDRYVRAKARLVAELLTRARAECGLPPVDYWDPEA